MENESRTMEDGTRKTETLDAAIDRAVREMLDVEPRADLRTRVLERIEHPRRAFTWTWVLAPIAAAAVLVLAVMLQEPEERLVSRPVTDIVLRAPDPQHPATIARREQPPNPQVIRPVKPQERRITAAVATADDTNFSAALPAGFAVIDALAPPPPIVVEHIPSAAPPTVAWLDIAPLRLPALEVNALADSPPERREE
jgi:hypothetical protein